MKIRSPQAKTWLMGGVLTLLLTVVLYYAGLMIIPPGYISETAAILVHGLIIGLCWLIISFLLAKFSLLKVLGVVSLLLAAIAAEKLLRIPLNPVTIPLLILFWLGVAYLIMPDFFSKYRIPILSVYGLILSYFFITRIQADYAAVHHQNFLNFLFIPLPVLAGLWGYEQWRWLKDLQTEKAKAELSLLKYQLNPHFFFNTLNNLYGLATEQSADAPGVILRLSDMMRYTIYEGKADFVPLGKEANYLNDYIELHKIRFRRNLRVTFAKQIMHHHQIAPLLLIVPLENAFKHGVEKQLDNPFIEMVIDTTPESIFFLIRNNFDLSTRKTPGIGLKNLRQRLHLIYPGRHKLNIEQSEQVYTLSLTIYP